jgi:hypothetical protein
MSMNRYEICTASRHGLGAEAVQSFDEGTKESEIFGDLWPWVRKAIQQDRCWQFNSTTALLSKDTIGPDDPNWTYRYAEPGASEDTGDFLRPIRCQGVGGSSVAFKYRRSKILRNEPIVRCLYQYDRIETEWPRWFYPYAIARLKWHACESLRGEGAVRDDAEREAERALIRAKNQDAGLEGAVTRLIGRNSKWKRVRF